MTLSQIMALALRQLDEDAQDIAEYAEAFRVYANIGYGIAVREFLKPREWIPLQTDERGEAALPDERVVRVVELRRGEDGGALPFRLDTDGKRLMLREKHAQAQALCEVSYPRLLADTDEPLLPESVHYALADYICYRHLSTGSLAKQSRAEFFLTNFYAAMRGLRPQGMGSETAYRNLYMVTDVRFVR